MEGGRSKKEREHKAADVLICHTLRLLPVKHHLPSNSTDLHHEAVSSVAEPSVALNIHTSKDKSCLSICLSEHPSNVEHLCRTCRAVVQHLINNVILYNNFQCAKLPNYLHNKPAFRNYLYNSFGQYAPYIVISSDCEITDNILII